jgi:hypothetical protein
MKLVTFYLYHRDTYYNKNLDFENFVPECILINLEQIGTCRLIKKSDDKNLLVEIKIVGFAEYLYGKFSTAVCDLNDLHRLLTSNSQITQTVSTTSDSTITNSVQHPPLLRREKGSK